MTDQRRLKSRKISEIMLDQAAEFLHVPDRFSLPIRELAEYRDLNQVKELKRAMLELEAIAREHGAKSGFWRRLQKVARQLSLEDKVEEYEAAFHIALKEKGD